METAAGIVQEAANPDANIIFGATASDDFQDEMRVTVIATGFDQASGEFEPIKVVEAVKAATPAAPAATTVKTGDIADIDEIFKIFNR